MKITKKVNTILLTKKIISKEKVTTNPLRVNVTVGVLPHQWIMVIMLKMELTTLMMYSTH